jgi:hypothetical protein
MQPTTSKLRKAAGIAFLAMAAFAFAGLVLAQAIDDQTPPYEPSLIN